MPAKMRIEFISDGFRDVLFAPALDSMLAAQARKRAQELEGEEGVPYTVEKKNFASRPVYLVRTEDEAGAERETIDHETWVNEILPRVGGPKWRPHGS